MANNRWTSTLGLANRAGKIVSGEEFVLKEIKTNRAKLILLSKDTSLNTEKRIIDKCNFYKVPVIRVESRYELGYAIGKDERVAVAIVDNGFAEKIRLYLEQP
ncbi:MAG: YlxQ family RNA-binding protein [Bacillales bacterium]|jgi:ribosomal protein L7Ae-like RNA K-turn-binding protein|nr:YlxQ family RNA-binding protein [Bacillales bacterium]